MRNPLTSLLGNLFISKSISLQTVTLASSLRFAPSNFNFAMRPLTEDESKAVFTKLANYIVRIIASVLTPLLH